MNELEIKKHSLPFSIKKILEFLYFIGNFAKTELVGAVRDDENNTCRNLYTGRVIKYLNPECKSNHLLEHRNSHIYMH